MNRIWCSLAIILLCPQARAQQTLGRLERLTPEFDRLVAPDAKIEVLARGFTWTEGPVWIGDSNGHLLFSDIPRNTIYKYQPGAPAGREVSVFMTPSGFTGVTYYGLEPGSNGLFLDGQGRLCMCEHGDRRVSVLTDNGGKMTLADRYQGRRLNSPNDAVLMKNGDIYFTDPPYGLPEQFADSRRELDFCGVYRLKPNGELTLLTPSIARPNGIALSPDEKFLYVAQSNPQQANWTRFEVRPDGTLGDSKELLNVTDRVGKEPGLPDGLEADSQGYLWASGPGGIYVISPKGQLVGRLVTEQRTSNCTLNPDGWLYLTVDSYLCRIRTLARPITR
ncbi:MAG: SMP-30/gluconolactonase/LRE family protein [Pirellulaceae bacterium]|nr:SMP-30/gluconolactonase/LRE family protein [Pirellulaceae bacterium]